MLISHVKQYILALVALLGLLRLSVPSSIGHYRLSWAFSATQAVDRSWCQPRVDSRGSPCAETSRTPPLTCTVAVVRRWLGCGCLRLLVHTVAGLAVSCSLGNSTVWLGGPFLWTKFVLQWKVWWIEGSQDVSGLVPAGLANLHVPRLSGGVFGVLLRCSALSRGRVIADPAGRSLSLQA